jgi:cytochrome c oxidase subunit IV
MSHDAGHHEEAHHGPTGYGMYFMTWFALVFLTGITVTAAGIHIGKMGVLVAMLIATLKASIVLWLFMHLKYEDATFHRLLLVVIAAMAIFIGMTFTDTLFR